MTHGSLFSGIGGFDLAAEWMGWENVFHCEMNPFGQRVLAHHFPNSKLHEDVKTFPSSNYVGRIDILTGGFPCQPYSTAGKRLGKDDDRHLWPFMLNIIRTIQPRYVVGENVRGLVNWNDGMVFDEVQADLEAAGYEILPFILPAAAVGAPHRRDRVWFIAHSNKCHDGRTARKDASAGGKERVQQRDAVRELAQSSEVQRLAADTESVRDNRRPAEVCKKERRQDGEQLAEPIERGEVWDAAHAKCNGLEHGAERGGAQGSEREARERVARHLAAESEKRDTAHADSKLRKCRHGERATGGRAVESHGAKPFDEPAGWAQFPTQPAICGGNDGLPAELDGITFPKWRNESIKAYGNAIVPQVAYQIFQAIQQTDDTLEQD